MNYKYLSHIYTDENQFHREKLQFFFDKSFRENDEALLRQQYVELRRLQLHDFFDSAPEPINLSSLAQSITIACDVLATGTGMSFIFCGDDDCYILGNERLITKALLNLLSNSYLYSKENLVTVSAVKCNDFTKLEILSGGHFITREDNRDGLKYVRKACERMNGKFFIEQNLTHTKAVIVLQNSATSKPCEYSFLDYLNDRLSPVYIEMFGMEYKN